MSNSLDQYRQLYINQLKQVEGINIQALPLYDQLPTGAKLEIPILFRLLVGDHSLIVKRKPIHICLVLDRSGSMRGQPLESCKKAVKLVMSQLGNEDKGSFVVYDDSVDVIFTRKTLSDYDSVTSLIDSVTDRGWTNISGGLQKAADILNTVENEEAPDHYQKLVFLFSDGEANRGITELDDLGKHMAKWVDKDGIRFSSFGIGLSYNEKWMRSIARGGEGNYFFIDNVNEVTSLVEKGLSGFTQLVGNHVNFKAKGVNGHFLTSLQGDKTTETLMNGKTLPYLRSLGLYQFLTTVEINGVPRGEDYEQEILDAVLSFNALPGLEHLSPQKTTVVVKFSDDVQFDNLKKNGDVVCYQVIGECAELNHKVDDALKEYRANDAINLKKQIVARYQEVLPLDQFGVIGALMEREKKTLASLEEEGLSSRTTKNQEYTASYGYSCTTTVKKNAWEKKKANESMEEDGDMGYGLF